MQWLAHALPPAYVFESLRALVHGQTVSFLPLFTGIALAAIYILLAVWIFKRVYRHAVRSGLIARYSAETVS
jgi:ABC-2 type transport system permease protein